MRRSLQTTDDAYVGGNITPIAPHVGGFVAEVAIVDSQRVNVGDPLMRLDPRDFQAGMDHASAVVAAKLAALEDFRARSTLQGR